MRGWPTNALFWHCGDQSKRAQMSKAIDDFEAARKKAMAIRPKVGGFSYLAETLRRAGVSRNIWTPPAVTLGALLVPGTADVRPFDRDALIIALRTDQAAKSTFPEFVVASWKAGIVRYDVDHRAWRYIFRLQRPGVCQRLSRRSNPVTITDANRQSPVTKLRANG